MLLKGCDKCQAQINLNVNIFLIFCLDKELKDDMAGSTAVVVIIKDGKIFCVSHLIFGEERHVL